MGIVHEVDNMSVSKSVMEAIARTSSHVGQITEESIHIPGYGVCNSDTCKREALASAKLAQDHTQKGNHGGAAYYHERAAMFHKALHGFMQSKLAQGAEKVAAVAESKLADTPQTVVQSVTEEQKEPHEGRVASKLKRQRRLKDRSDEKKEREDK